MESNLITVTITGVTYALMVILAGAGLAITLRFFLKRNGPLAKLAQKSSVFTTTYAVAVPIVGLSAIMAFLAIQLLGWFFGVPSGSLFIFLVGITITGVVTLAMYYVLDNFYRGPTRPSTG